MLLHDLENVERIHIWRTLKGVQLNTQDIGAAGWRVTSAKTLADAWQQHFNEDIKEDPFE